jgi:hypothetical protein
MFCIKVQVFLLILVLAWTMLKLEKSILSKLYYFCNFPLLLNITTLHGFFPEWELHPGNEIWANQRALFGPLAMPTLFFYNLYDYICTVADCVIVTKWMFWILFWRWSKVWLQALLQGNLFVYTTSSQSCRYRPRSEGKIYFMHVRQCNVRYPSYCKNGPVLLM